MRVIPYLGMPLGGVLLAIGLLQPLETAAQGNAAPVISRTDQTESALPEAGKSGVTTPRPDAPGSIQDNSFLVEEAYNQEDGVVQHINSFTRYSLSKDWVYSFTQEWPGVPNFRHQFSYTLLAQSAGAYPGSGAGVGDAMLSYRYQLVGNGKTRFAFAPRLSLLIPSGNSKLGRGLGGWGMQVNLPVSYELTPRVVTHWNAGTTIVPRAQDAAGDKSFSTGYNLGQSVIWLAHPRFNVMLETIWTSMGAVVGPHQTQPVHSLLLSPGIRWAYNLNHQLQIVPGIAVPLGVGPSAGEKGILLYLSFEHPFRKSSAEKAEALTRSK